MAIDPTSPPTTEPLQVMAGTTWAWTREDLTDYPASTYTLKYYLVSSTKQYTITATADGDNHDVTVAAATTATYTPGTYTWIAVCSTSTTAYEVDRGTIEILPDLSTTLATGYDTRSHAKTMLDAIEATLESTATAEQLDLVRKAIGDKALDRNRELLLKFRSYYRNEYQAEIAREKSRRGRASGNKIKTRFVAP